MEPEGHLKEKVTEQNSDELVAPVKVGNVILLSTKFWQFLKNLFKTDMALEHGSGKVLVREVPREKRARKTPVKARTDQKRQQNCLYPRCLPAESRFCRTDPESSMTA